MNICYVCYDGLLTLAQYIRKEGKFETVAQNS